MRSAASPQRVARVHGASPRSDLSPRPPPPAAPAASSSSSANSGPSGSILPVLSPASHMPVRAPSPNAFKRSAWTTPRSPSEGTSRAEAAASQTLPRRHSRQFEGEADAELHDRSKHSDGAAHQLEQFTYMEQMYTSIQALNAELDKERLERAQLLLAASADGVEGDVATALEYSERGRHPFARSGYDEPEMKLVVELPPTVGASPSRGVRPRAASPSHHYHYQQESQSHPQPQPPKRPTAPTQGVPSLSKDQIELCASLGKNAELRIRTREMEKSAEKTSAQLDQLQKQTKLAERRVASREEKLRMLLKEKLHWQKELKDLREQVVEEKMRQVELFRRLEAAKREYAARTEQMERDLCDMDDENQSLRAQVAETKAHMAFQTRKLEDVARQAREEREKLVACVAETRCKFKEWKEGEAVALRSAREQAVNSLKTEYELKIARHQEEKQKLREKVRDLEVSLRLTQKDRSLSPLELSLRKATILGSKDSSGTSESELIEAHARIRELEALMEHTQEYQKRQEHIIRVSEATISRLVQEREVTALEHLSMQQLGERCSSSAYSLPEASAYSLSVPNYSTFSPIVEQRDATARLAYGSIKTPSNRPDNSTHAKSKARIQPVPSPRLLTSQTCADSQSEQPSSSTSSTFSLMAAAPPSKLSRSSIGDDKNYFDSSDIEVTSRPDAGVATELTAQPELVLPELIVDEDGDMVTRAPDDSLETEVSEFATPSSPSNEQVLANEVARLQKQLAELKTMILSQADSNSKLNLDSVFPAPDSNADDASSTLLADISVAESDIGSEDVRSDSIISRQKGEADKILRDDRSAGDEAALERAEEFIDERDSQVVPAEMTGTDSPDQVKDGAADVELDLDCVIDSTGIADLLAVEDDHDMPDKRTDDSSTKALESRDFEVVGTDATIQEMLDVKDKNLGADLHENMFGNANAIDDLEHSCEVASSCIETYAAAAEEHVRKDSSCLHQDELPDSDSTSFSPDGQISSYGMESAQENLADNPLSTDLVDDLVESADILGEVDQNVEDALIEPRDSACDKLPAIELESDLLDAALDVAETKDCDADHDILPESARMEAATDSDMIERMIPSESFNSDAEIETSSLPEHSVEVTCGDSTITSQIEDDHPLSSDSTSDVAEVTSGGMMVQESDTTHFTSDDVSLNESLDSKRCCEESEESGEGVPSSLVGEADNRDCGAAAEHERDDLSGVILENTNAEGGIETAMPSSAGAGTGDEEHSTTLSNDEKLDRTGADESTVGESFDNWATRDTVGVVATNTVASVLRKGLHHSLVLHHEIRKQVSKALVTGIVSEAVGSIAREKRRVLPDPAAVVTDSLGNSLVLKEQDTTVSLMAAFDHCAEVAEGESELASPAKICTPADGVSDAPQDVSIRDVMVCNDTGISNSAGDPGARIAQTKVENAVPAVADGCNQATNGAGVTDMPSGITESANEQLAVEETQDNVFSASTDALVTAEEGANSSESFSAVEVPDSDLPSEARAEFDDGATASDLPDSREVEGYTDRSPQNAQLSSDISADELMVAVKITAAHTVKSAVRQGLRHSLVLHHQQRKHVSKTFVLGIVRNVVTTILDGDKSPAPQMYDELGNLVCQNEGDKRPHEAPKTSEAELPADHVVSAEDEAAQPVREDAAEVHLDDKSPDPEANISCEEDDTVHACSPDLQARNEPRSLTIAGKENTDESETSLISATTSVGQPPQHEMSATDFVAAVEAEAIRSASASIMNQRLVAYERESDAKIPTNQVETVVSDDQGNSEAFTVEHQSVAGLHSTLCGSESAVMSDSERCVSSNDAPDDEAIDFVFVGTAAGAEDHDARDAAQIAGKLCHDAKADLEYGGEGERQTNSELSEQSDIAVESDASVANNSAQSQLENGAGILSTGTEKSESGWLVDSIVQTSTQLSVDAMASALETYSGLSRVPVGSEPTGNNESAGPGDDPVSEWEDSGVEDLTANSSENGNGGLERKENEFPVRESRTPTDTKHVAAKANEVNESGQSVAHFVNVPDPDTHKSNDDGAVIDHDNVQCALESDICAELRNAPIHVGVSDGEDPKQILGVVTDHLGVFSRANIHEDALCSTGRLSHHLNGGTENVRSVGAADETDECNNVVDELIAAVEQNSTPDCTAPGAGGPAVETDPSAHDTSADVHPCDATTATIDPDSALLVVTDSTASTSPDDPFVAEIHSEQSKRLEHFPGQDPSSNVELFGIRDDKLSDSAPVPVTFVGDVVTTDPESVPFNSANVEASSTRCQVEITPDPSDAADGCADTPECTAIKATAPTTSEALCKDDASTVHPASLDDAISTGANCAAPESKSAVSDSSVGSQATEKQTECDQAEVRAALTNLLDDVERVGISIVPEIPGESKVAWMTLPPNGNEGKSAPKPTRRVERRRTSRRLFDASRYASMETMRDPTLAAYDAHREQGQPFALLDANILTIDPHARHMQYDESDKTDVEIRAKRKNIDQDNHRKSIAYRSIPAFNYAPVLVRFQWSDFVVATPIPISNPKASSPGDKKSWSSASPVKSMRLLMKKGVKLPCGSYVIVSAFIRPLEDGNENLRIHIYDSEWVEEFQYDFSEDHLKEYVHEWGGRDEEAKLFMTKLEFRREEGGIIIRLPDKVGCGSSQDGKQPATASSVSATSIDSKEHRSSDRSLPYRSSRHSQKASTGTRNNSL